MTQSERAVDRESPTPGPPARTPRRAALAAFLGSTLEYYDFAIYGTASALLFNVLFFPTEDPEVGLVASLATFGLAYVARPVGAVLFGHLGDRIGRKSILLLTIAIMGTATFAVGLMPTYGQVGLWAPVVLVILRLVQGVSAGAEAPGAGALTIEHSPEGRRAFFSSSVMVGFAAGTTLATLVFAPVTLLPAEALYSWGWRLPFLASVLVTGVGYYFRRRLAETPVFEQVKEKREVIRAPIVAVFRTQAADVLRVVVITFLAVMQTIFNVFGLSYATSPEIGVGRTAMLVINAVVLGSTVVIVPLVARIADRVGRRPVLLTGALGCAGSVFFYFWCLSTGNIGLILLGSFVNVGLFFSCYTAVYLAFFGEMFRAPVRFTGVAVGQQISLVATGFAPVVAGLLLQPGPSGWLPVAWFTAGMMILAAIGVLSSRETHLVPLERLGDKQP